MNDPFIRLPYLGGSIYIRRSQVVMLEPVEYDGRAGTSIAFRLGEHTTSRRILLSCDEVMALLDGVTFRSALLLAKDVLWDMIIRTSNYDWNADPDSITLKQGEAFKAIEAALVSPRAGG